MKFNLYNPGHYLVQTLPLPFECETHGSPEAPLLGISVKLDPPLLSEMVMAMGDAGAPALSPTPMASVAMTEGMQHAVARLANTLKCETECAVMGVSRIREVVFEALKGEQGPAPQGAGERPRALFTHCAGAIEASRKLRR